MTPNIFDILKINILFHYTAVIVYLFNNSVSFAFGKNSKGLTNLDTFFISRIVDDEDNVIIGLHDVRHAVDDFSSGLNGIANFQNDWGRSFSHISFFSLCNNVQNQNFFVFLNIFREAFIISSYKDSFFESSNFSVTVDGHVSNANELRKLYSANTICRPTTK